MEPAGPDRPQASTPALDGRETILASAERITVVGRWVVLAAAVILNHFGNRNPATSVLAVDLALAGWALVNVAVSLLLLRGFRPDRWFGFLTTGIDLVVATTILYLAGGYGAPTDFSLLFYLLIVASAVRLGLPGALATAVVVSILYVVVGGTSGFASLTPPPGFVVGRIFLFLFVALVAGLLVGDLRNRLDRAVRSAIERAAQLDETRRREEFERERAAHLQAPVAEALQQVEFYGIHVSLYGTTKTTYERVTGIPGSYEPFIQGLQCLASSKLPVVVRMPVMTDNVQEVRDARILVENFGFKFQYCLDITPKTNGDLSPLTHRLSPADKIRIDYDMIGYRYNKLTGEESCMVVKRDFISCSCGRDRFAITPYGEMNLCIAFPFPKFDLRKGTVKEGWEVLKKTVDEARPNDRYECPTCQVRTNCRQGRSDAWLETGDMSVCLPHYKEFAVLEKNLHERFNRR